MPIVPKPYTHVPDALIESAKVNTNDDTMYALVNGGLDNLNISTSAAIAQSKIFGLPTDLNSKKASSDFWRLQDRSEIRILNNAAQTNLTRADIPAGTMNATDCLNGKHVALIERILDGSTVFLLYYWGPIGSQDLVFQASFTNGSGVTLSNVGVTTNFHIFNRASQSVQGISFVTVFNDSVSGSHTQSVVTGISMNTADLNSILINGLWSLANIENSVLGLGVEMFRQR